MIQEGHIKAGEENLIKTAGEYFVMDELLRHGIISGLAPRNGLNFDIVATWKRRAACVRVKAKSYNACGWQWNLEKTGDIFRDLTHEGDFVSLVNLHLENARPEFFVVPTHLVDKWLRSNYGKQINTPRSCGQRRNKDTQRTLVYSRFKGKLDAYRNAWDQLWG